MTGSRCPVPPSGTDGRIPWNSFFARASATNRAAPVSSISAVAAIADTGTALIGVVLRRSFGSGAKPIASTSKVPGEEKTTGTASVTSESDRPWLA